MSAALDERLRAQRDHYHREAEATTGDLHDVDVRTARQRRHQRLATGSAAAVAIVLIAVLINRQASAPPPFPAVDPSVSTVPAPGPDPATTVAPGPDATTATESHPEASDPAAATTTTRATLAPTAPDIRTVDFANMTYPADSCPGGGFADPPPGGFPLRDGRFVGGAHGHQVYLSEERRYGDVTGDGLEDAAITLTCATGAGSGTSINPWVFAADGGAPGGIRRLPYPALTAAVMEEVGLPGAVTDAGLVTGMAGTLTIEWVQEASGGVPNMNTIVATRLRWDGRAWQPAGAPTVLQRPVIDQ